MKVLSLKMTILSSLFGALSLLLLLSLSDGLVWAKDYGQSKQSYDKLITRLKSSVSGSLGIGLDIGPGYAAPYHSKDLQGLDSILASDDFKNYIESFQISCKKRVSSLELDSEPDYFLGPHTLVLSSDQVRNYQSFFDNLIFECESAYELIQKINSVPRAIKYELRLGDLVSGKLDFNKLKQWIDIFDTVIARQSFSEFYNNCFVKVKKVSLADYNGIETDGLMSVDLNMSPVILVGELFRTGAVCSRINEKIIRLNSEFSLKHGIYFQHVLNDLFTKRVDETTLNKWIQKFEEDESLIVKYRDSILAKSGKNDFHRVKSCLSKGINAQKCHQEYPIVVQLTALDGSSPTKIGGGANFAGTMFSLFQLSVRLNSVSTTGNPKALSQYVIHQIDLAMLDTIVFLDVNKDPDLTANNK